MLALFMIIEDFFFLITQIFNRIKYLILFWDLGWPIFEIHRLEIIRYFWLISLICIKIVVFSYLPIHRHVRSQLPNILYLQKILLHIFKPFQILDCQLFLMTLIQHSFINYLDLCSYIALFFSLFLDLPYHVLDGPSGDWVKWYEIRMFDTFLGYIVILLEFE